MSRVDGKDDDRMPCLGDSSASYQYFKFNSRYERIWGTHFDER